MGSSQSVLQAKGYELVRKQEKMMLVKNKDGDQFVIKKLRAKKDNVSNFLQQLDHPHIVHHKEIIEDHGCLSLVVEHCEGGDLAELTKLKFKGKLTFSEILDWIVKICMALKHLHDQQILHKNLQPETIFFTACGTIRLGEFGAIREWSTEAQRAETKSLSYVAPENLNGRPFDEKSEIWSLGCVIYEMCMLKCAFTGRSTVDIIAKILNSSYEALPETFSEDLHQLVKDTLQTDPANRPSVSEILMRPFIINHLYEKSTQTTEELYERLKVLEELANGLERVHFNTTVGSLTGGVVGLAGGITSIVGLILTPFTLGASLIVTGVGIGVAVAGGVAAGASNVTKMVNERSDRQKIKMLITELQEKITSTSSCIRNIHIAIETQKVLSKSKSWSSEESETDWANVGARLGRGLGGISELVRLIQVGNVGRIAAQTARAVRVAEAATGVLTGLFVAVDIFFIALDAKEIHKLRKDYASIATQRESENAATNGDNSEHNNAGNQKLQSEIMKFAKKIKETKEELKKILDELKDELEKLEPEIQTQITRNMRVNNA
ncbi:hypothetical protein ABG768_024694 [Culter alburnus]|uniref:non-specific serine/threonine protein kinase n=1 Tax=Culter alburnus TaxID=194366 RepID=A0AAW2AFI1_CULAL